MSGAEADGIRCMLMRGGTSKGAFFLAGDLPADTARRDDVLLRVMGSPDPMQIDGLGGAHPLTSKVAVVSASTEPGVDLDYLFLQIGVDEPLVSTTQTCGNLLAAVGPFALERGLVSATDPVTTVRIRLRNTGDLSIESFSTPGGRVEYAGDTAIDGVPGAAGRIEIETSAAEDSRLFPTGAVSDDLDGHRATLIDNGMPVALVRAEDLGIRGDESPETLEGAPSVKDAVGRIRRLAGERMGLGDVRDATVPKVILLSAPRHGGAIGTRAFIPHRVHTSIGVLMAASVAAAVCIPGTVAAEIASPPEDGAVEIEHPSGTFAAQVSVGRGEDGTWRASSLSVRTARKIFDGVVYPRPHL